MFLMSFSLPVLLDQPKVFLPQGDRFPFYTMDILSLLQGHRTELPQMQLPLRLVVQLEFMRFQVPILFPPGYLKQKDSTLAI